MEDGKRLVFVTVGTTSFDALVKAVVSPNVKDELHKRGYTHLLIQMGRGIYSPPKVLLCHYCVLEESLIALSSDVYIFCSLCLNFLIQCDGADGSSLAVDYFTFSSSIADYIRSASLVISHAG